MKLLILNQAFYPDVVSSAQHAADLALALVDAGHEVTVICSRRAYDDPSTVFPCNEMCKGIRIERVRSTGLGKGAKWRRAVDFATFIASCTLRLLLFPRVDVVVSLTSPPLLPLIAALAVPFKAKRFVFWSMDLNPDEAIAAEWLRAGSPVSRVLSVLLSHSLKKADRIIALDRFMKQRIEAKGIDNKKITVIPPWSHDEYVSFDATGREEFRARYSLTNKFVVMYSGNHSPCHPLGTLLQAAERLASRDEIVFCLVGGGSEFRKVQQELHSRGARNILCIPYQPITKLAAALSAADLHVVLMGNPFVGIVHPCKIYNILAVGRPFLYVGPIESHVGDILSNVPGLGFTHRHGDVEQVVASITAACARRSHNGVAKVAEQFSHKRLVPEMVSVIDELMGQLQKKKKPQTEEQDSEADRLVG
jgi:glycosyltransferase involved in cell wall biosynthesis